MQSVNFQLMSTIFDCLSAHRVKKKKKKKKKKKRTFFKVRAGCPVETMLNV